MVGQIRYSNDYGIDESCRFGGSAEQKREKKKVGMQKSLFTAIDALLYVFACISTSTPLFLFSFLTFGFGSGYCRAYTIFLLFFTLCTLANPSSESPPN